MQNERDMPAGLREVLTFWFEELAPQHWFTRDESVDQSIATRFGDLYESLRTQLPAFETLDATQTLAAIIVLDQFPRNMFRQSSQSFATDQVALALSMHAVGQGLDRQFGDDANGKARRQFLYMPYMHSEDHAVQLQALQLFADLSEQNVKFAKQHEEIIARFGRFPHRNATLGRVSTPEEVEFLKTHPGF